MPNFSGEHEETEEEKLDPFAGWEPSPVPIAADGAVMPGFASVPDRALPVLSDSVCEKGPCRYYWQMVLPFDSGNPEETWAALGLRKPRHYVNTCIYGPQETEFADQKPEECSGWDPKSVHVPAFRRWLMRLAGAFSSRPFEDRALEYRQERWRRENEPHEEIDESLAE